MEATKTLQGFKKSFTGFMEENTLWSLLPIQSHYEVPEPSASRRGEDIQESLLQAPLDTSSLGTHWGDAPLV